MGDIVQLIIEADFNSTDEEILFDDIVFSGGAIIDCLNDTEAPTVNCPANITTSNDAGLCSAVVNFSATAFDNCSDVTPVFDIASGSIFNVGTTTVTASATDGVNLTGSCSFTVTVNDTEAPTINCPANISVSNDAGQCGAIVQFTPTASDNCPGVSVTTDIASNTLFSVGTTQVTATATDASNGKASCTFDVTVQDTEDPTISCPADITVSNDPGQCGAVVSFSVTGADNCPSTSINSVPGNGSFFSVGTTAVNSTITDGAGRTATCSFNVTVNDTEAPTANCPADITVNNDAGQCGAVVQFTPTASDNCPGGSVSTDIASNTFFSVGTTQVTATAMDAAGLTGTCSFNVTINDTEAPGITCPTMAPH